MQPGWATSLWGCTVGFGGWEVSGPGSLGPVLIWPQLISGVISSVPARSEGKIEGFLGSFELHGSASPISAGAPRSPVGADGQKRTETELLYKVFSLLSWLVWYILASASYKGGATAMAFGQVQGGMRGCPSPPPGTDTFKGSRATRTQHRCGKRVRPREQVGRPHFVSLGPHLRASTSTSHLSAVKRGAGDMCGEACP